MNKYLKSKKYRMLLLSFTVFCVSLLCTMSACKSRDEYVNNRLAVSIAFEYKEFFLEEKFTVEDFNSAYIESIQYGPWYSNAGGVEVGFIYVQLKEKYVKHIDKVMQSINELDFVTKVEKIPVIYISDP